MKLRIRGSSLRFRLTQSEVRRLESGERVSESVEFPHSADSLVYALVAGRRSERVSASFSGREIVVEIPAGLVRSWAGSDQVGIEELESWGAGKDFHVLIEKDFRCSQPRPGEDERDNFPRPLESSALEPPVHRDCRS